MKYFSVLPLAALASAIVIPTEQVLNDVSIEGNHRASQIEKSVAWSKDEILNSFKKHYEEVTDTVDETTKAVKGQAKNALDEALAFSHNVGSSFTESAFDAEAWVESFADETFDVFEHDDPHHPHPPEKGPPGPPHHGPHHGPPHDGPPHHGPPHDGPPHHGPPRDGPPHHGPPHDGPPHHGPPHHKIPGVPVKPPQHGEPNQTVYQLISESKYTTKLAKLLDDYPDLVKTLNSTKANFTVFAPTDSAFEKIPEHAPKPTKEQLEAVLLYHISPGFYPAGRVLVTHTIPTLLKGEHLADEPEPQRLAVKTTFRGLTLNFYSRVVAVDIFGTNGVIHGVDTLLIPPPNVIKIIDLLPSEFSTLELGLGKTGLLEEFNTTHHPGGTFFAPNNFAFLKLGPRINAFLFSEYGRKYLKALLEYHVVPGTTLYSDAIYSNHLNKTDEHHKVPKGYYHYTLPTLLHDQVLEVDVGRYGGFISIKINGFGRVSVQDGIAEDGVIQVVSDVLIPPKNKLQPPATQEKKGFFGKIGRWFHAEKDELTLEEFVQRMAPFVGETAEEALYRVEM